LDKLKEVELETSFTTDPLLTHADPSKSFVLETNAFYFTFGTMFSQFQVNDLFHLVNFHSHKFFLVEINYKIHDIELLAIVDAFGKWCHLLKGAQHEILVYFDYKNL
jgi:hypothetical protein